MKKIIYSILAVAAITLLSFMPSGGKFAVISGNTAFLKNPITIHVKFDMSKSSIDGLDSEAGFVEYHMKKKKTPADAKKWKDGWDKDKTNFGEGYVTFLNSKLKKAPATFNLDDPDSDYTMLVEVMHIQTGTAVKYSSVESKLKFTETKSSEEKAVIYVPATRGLQQGPMSPTTGMRVQYSLSQSAAQFVKYYKKMLK